MLIKTQWTVSELATSHLLRGALGLGLNTNHKLMAFSRYHQLLYTVHGGQRSLPARHACAPGDLLCLVSQLVTSQLVNTTHSLK